ncbi:MAG: hypothetical protein AB7O21_19595 [Gammaproteobacteria bacterium]
MRPERVVRGYGLYEQLREHKPAMVIAVDADGDETKINVPDVRQKHARVMTTLKELAWVRCDLLDKKGGLLYRHHRNADDRETAAGDLEELPSQTRHSAELSNLLKLMLHAQETVLIRHERSMQPVLDAHIKILEQAMRRLELQETQYERAMQLNHQLSTDLVQVQLAQLGAGDGGGEDGRPRSDRAVDALLPAILKAAMSKDKDETAAATKKKNGVSEKAKEQRPVPASSAPSE